MEFQSFTKNYEDLCSEAGFQFVFKCDVCGDGYKSKFVESKTYKKANMFNMFSKAVQVGAVLAGAYRVGNAVQPGREHDEPEPLGHDAGMAQGIRGSVRAGSERGQGPLPPLPRSVTATCAMRTGTKTMACA